jgi:hypothetical protein
MTTEIKTNNESNESKQQISDRLIKLDQTPLLSPARPRLVYF